MVKNVLPDQIKDKYKIKINAPLVELDNIFSKAYKLEDSKSGEIDSLYCAVLDRKYPYRLTVINYLKKNDIANLISPIEAEIFTSSIDKKQNIAIILPRHPPVSLKDYVKEKSGLSISYITYNILLPINAVIEKLQLANITHGRINPDNIFIDSKGEIAIGECVTEICGYSQKYYFESLDRSECENFGKNNGDENADYFALGLVCLYSFLGKYSFDTEDREALRNRRFTEGSFKAYVGNIILPTDIGDLVRGLLIDRSKDRWRSKNILDWHNRKKYQAPIDDHVESRKHLIFNSQYYLNSRHIAYDLFKYWEISKYFIKDDHLTKWVERGLNNSYMVEKINYVIKSSKSSLNNENSDIVLMKIISVLDSNGPIRFKNIVLYINTISYLIAFGFAQAQNNYLNIAAKILASNIWHGIIDINKFQKTKEQTNLIFNLDNCRKYVNNTDLGYGMERCLYELNKSLPCQSTTFDNEFIDNIIDLIDFLEKKAADSQNIIMDRHIAAFIMSKINYNSEHILKSLKNYPDFFSNKDVNILAILASVQKESGKKILSNLSKYIFSNLSSVEEIINNKNYKNEFRTKLSKISETGSLLSMLKFISDVDYIRKDLEGFRKAIDKFQMMNDKKNLLNQERKIYETGYRYGLKLTVIVSYSLFTIVLLYLFLYI